MLNLNFKPNNGVNSNEYIEIIKILLSLKTLNTSLQMIGEEDLKKLMLAKNESFNLALYDRYRSLVYGCFISFCKDKSMAMELMKRVFEQAEMEFKTTGTVNGKLSIWLLRISRKISREYLLDFSIKKSIEERCPVQLILCEGFSPKEAAGLLGINLVDVLGKLRQNLRG